MTQLHRKSWQSASLMEELKMWAWSEGGKNTLIQRPTQMHD